MHKQESWIGNINFGIAEYKFPAFSKRPTDETGKSFCVCVCSDVRILKSSILRHSAD